MNRKKVATPTKETVTKKMVEQDLLSISDLFHENTKMRRYQEKTLGERIAFITDNPILLKIISQGFKIYSAAPQVKLTKDFSPGTMSFERVMLKRRSIREYTGEALTIDEVAKLLYLSYGITGSFQFGEEDNVQYLRAAPSGGALYPIEIYPIVLNAENLKRGLYHYNVKNHLLEFLKPGNFRVRLMECVFYQEIISTASVVFVMTGVFDRTRFKYGERGYRYVLFDAGHLAQNIYLTATAMQLGVVTIAGFLDAEMAHILEIDGIDEAVLYLAAVGKIQRDK